MTGRGQPYSSTSIWWVVRAAWLRLHAPRRRLSPEPSWAHWVTAGHDPLDAGGTAGQPRATAASSNTLMVVGSRGAYRHDLRVGGRIAVLHRAVEPPSEDFAVSDQHGADGHLAR